MGTEGNELYRLLIRLTGLEEQQVKAELNPLLKRLNMSPETLTMEDVRRAMIVYLDEFSAQVGSDDVEALAELDSLDLEPIEA